MDAARRSIYNKANARPSAACTKPRAFHQQPSFARRSPFFVVPKPAYFSLPVLRPRSTTRTVLSTSLRRWSQVDPVHKTRKASVCAFTPVPVFQPEYYFAYSNETPIKLYTKYILVSSCDSRPLASSRIQPSFETKREGMRRSRLKLKPKMICKARQQPIHHLWRSNAQYDDLQRGLYRSCPSYSSGHIQQGILPLLDTRTKIIPPSKAAT